MKAKPGHRKPLPHPIRRRRLLVGGLALVMILVVLFNPLVPTRAVQPIMLVAIVMVVLLLRPLEQKYPRDQYDWGSKRWHILVVGAAVSVLVLGVLVRVVWFDR